MIRIRLSPIPSMMLLLAALALVLSGCSPRARATLVPTLVPTIDLQPGYPVPQAAEPTAYPAEPGLTGPGALPEAYPPGPVGVQVIDNLSQITARLVSQAPDESVPGKIRLRVEVLSSAPVEGYVEYTTGAVGQEIDLLVPMEELPALEPGDTLRAQVRYEGDERGGAYYAGVVERVTP